MGNSWAVVATVDEPPQLVAAFVAHHLNAGACEVHLFLDNPDEETETLLRAMPGCILTVCNQNFWRESAFGRRPYLHTKRQNLNANSAYGRCKADWLLHCDADEFVRDGAALSAELLRFGRAVKHLRLHVAERVMPADEAQTSIFDGLFRLPGTDMERELDDIYHPVSGFLEKGLTGHHNGKALSRTGCGLEIGLHQPQGGIPARKIRQTNLLHFDGLTPFHFQIKLLRRAQEKPTAGKTRHRPVRVTQFAAMKENLSDPEFCAAMTSALKCLRPDQIARLDGLGLVQHARFHPDLGGLALDLSVAGFDAALENRFAEFLRQINREKQS